MTDCRETLESFIRRHEAVYGTTCHAIRWTIETQDKLIARIAATEHAQEQLEHKYSRLRVALREALNRLQPHVLSVYVSGMTVSTGPTEDEVLLAHRDAHLRWIDETGRLLTDDNTDEKG